MCFLAKAKDQFGIRGFLFILVLILAFPLTAKEKSKLVQSKKTENIELLRVDQDLIQWLVTALNFLEGESRIEDIKKLSERYAFIFDQSLQERFLQHWISLKDRNLLLKYFRGLVATHRCKDPLRQKLEPCRYFLQLWDGQLASTIYFEDSAGKIRNIEMALEKKNCVLASDLLKELELKEGFLRSLVDTQLRIAECLKSPEMAEIVQKKFQETRIFSSEL